MRLSILALTCCLITNQALAQVYRYVDAHGNTVYTDSPPEQVDAERIQLPAINSLPAPTPSTSKAQKPTPEETAVDADAQAYSQLNLLLPDAEAIRANNGSFIVNVIIEPQLRAQHRLQLIVDGQAHGSPSNSLSLMAQNLDRGEHSIAVQVLSGDTVVQQTAAQIINVQRTHINAPSRRRTP